MKALAIGLDSAPGSTRELWRPRFSDATAIVSVETVDEATAALGDGSFDAALITTGLLEREGLGLVSKLRGASPTTAFILLAGPGSAPPGALRALKLRAGMDEVLVPTPPGQDPGAVLRRAVLRRLRLGERMQREPAVLVVDDDPDALAAITEALRRARIRAIPASDPLTGLELLAEHLPAVIVTDLKMPDLSGSELVAAALRFDPEVVPIVVTGFATLDGAVESLRAGAFDFLVKPLTPDQVVGGVRRAFTRALVGTRGRALLRPGGGAGRAAVRVLLVEDSPGDELLLRRMVEHVAPTRFQITTATTLKEGLSCLGSAPDPFDVVLLDLNLPDATGLATFAEVHIKAPLIPIVVLTGLEDAALTEQVLLAGAHEYLVKGKSSGELVVTRITYAIDRMQLVDQLAGLAREVRASDASRRSLIERNADAMVVVDEAGHVLFANESSGTLFGRPQHALIGEPVSIPLALNPGRRAGEEVEAELVRPDGTRLWVAVRTVETEWHGRLVRLATLRDITERKTADSLRARLAHADRLIAIGQLAAGVAHEINNPAAFILANLRTLEANAEMLGHECVRLQDLLEARGDHALVESITRAGVPSAVRESREMIRDNIQGMERIAKIVKDLRGFSRIERDEVRPVDLTAVITSACNLVAHEIRHRARFVQDLAPLPLIAGDEGRLGQVVVNLLVNAAQAIEGGVPDEQEVRIAARHDDATIRLTVKDTGRGIAPEHLRRIFDPFFTTKGMGRGTGLGLSITSEIVAKHQGTITVESAVGKGTTFTVELPRDSGLVVEAGAVPTVVSPATKRRARILFVDDEPMLRKAVARMLRDHDIVLADGGQSGLDVLMHDQAFDLVLCDLMMPELDGPSLYGAIALAHPALARRFVFITGGAFTPRAMEFLAGRHANVLEKPLNRAALDALIGRFVGTEVGP